MKIELKLYEDQVEAEAPEDLAWILLLNGEEFPSRGSSIMSYDTAGKIIIKLMEIEDLAENV